MLTQERPTPATAPNPAAASEQTVDLSDNALVVLEKRYLRKDGDGNIVETPDQMLRRVARAIAQAETIYGTRSDAAHWEDEFYDVMARLDFVPNSPTLMNAGIGLQDGRAQGLSPPASSWVSRTPWTA